MMIERTDGMLTFLKELEGYPRVARSGILLRYAMMEYDRPRQTSHRRARVLAYEKKQCLHSGMSLEVARFAATTLIKDWKSLPDRLQDLNSLQNALLDKMPLEQSGPP